ncbi:hypothetical protein MTYM_00077 [Methylococcales bacterium]|nr:hypothetical protein MTYM_00077 [Methylococcales bacterium]
MPTKEATLLKWETMMVTREGSRQLHEGKWPVISAWMPESSAMDGNVQVVQVLDRRSVPADRIIG